MLAKDGQVPRWGQCWLPHDAPRRRPHPSCCVGERVPLTLGGDPRNKAIPGDKVSQTGGITLLWPDRR